MAEEPQTPTLFSEPPVGTKEQEEVLRAAAEAAGELDHILPDLRRLAVRMIRLNLDPKNAQDHDPRNLKVIAGSMERYKQRTTLVVNWNDALIPGRITKGNGTFTTAKMLNWRWIAVVGTDDDPDEAMGYGMLDNRSSALSRPNYDQTNKNMRNLHAAGHPVLELMYTDEEALPLLREDFAPSPISNEQFDAGMLRGRAISKITASERLIVDQAIELCRAQESKALTEGSCLEKICKDYLASVAVRVSAEASPGELPPPNGAEDSDSLPLF